MLNAIQITEIVALQFEKKRESETVKVKKQSEGLLRKTV